MIMVWSGWGIQVPLYVVLAFFLATLGLTPLHLTAGLETAASIGLAGALSGGAIYLTAMKLESRPGRDFIDAQTNQRFTVKPSAGSFFFIPTRYWAFIVPLLAFLFAGFGMMNPSKAAAAPTEITEPASAPASAPATAT